MVISHGISCARQVYQMNCYENKITPHGFLTVLHSLQKQASLNWCQTSVIVNYHCVAV